jgi:FAD:protein FMN transferase
MTYASLPAMGCLFEVWLCGDDEAWLAGVAEEALAEVARLEAQLSHYRDDSDVARLNALAARRVPARAQPGEGAVRVEPALFGLLERCARLSRATGGAFDITAGPLVKAWGFYHGEGRVPTEEELAAARARVGMARVRLDRERSAVRFDVPGMEINLGAVGKGYALDQAAEVLRFYGVERAVIHGGRSTILAIGAPEAKCGGAALGPLPDEEGWPFTLKDPRDRHTPLYHVSLRDRALSTSGDTEQFFEAEGRRYGHLLDPRTGRPVEGMRCVWVIAPAGYPRDSAGGAESDALATAFFVMGPEATRAFCRERPELEVVLVEDAGPPSGCAALRVTRVGPGETFETRQLS